MIPFPLSLDTPMAHDGPLPASADVVVIGGGILGVATALYLAQSGVQVLLLEKGRIAAEQSSRNWGWIRVQGRDFDEIPIALESQRLWHELAPQLDTDIGLTQGGVAFLAKDADAMGRYADWADQAAPFDLGTQVLDSTGVAQILPDAARRWHGALWTASDMRAEPFVAVPALARLAAAQGAQLREGVAVRLLDIEAGRVTGVITEKGRVRAGAVVLAGGSWSSLMLRRHGVSIPQLSVRATVARTAPLPEIFTGGAVDDRFAFRRRADGGYTLAPSGFHELYIGPDAFRAFAGYLPHLLEDPLGTRYLPAAPRGFPDAWGTPRRWAGDGTSPFERCRVLNPAPNRAKTRMIGQALADTFPASGGVDIIQAWAGMIDTMPDVVPVVDQVAALPGLSVATGMCGHGFGIGPAFGRIMADLVQGNAPGHDLSRFRLSRFSDGSKLVLGPNL